MDSSFTTSPGTGTPAALAYRNPPHNTEAEQALLGAMLVNNATYHRVSEYLLSDHFYNPAHQRIYAAIVKLVDRGHIADPLTLKNYFDQDGNLSEIGGAAYIARLAGAIVNIVSASDYARVIYDCYLRRQLIEIGTDTVNDSYEHAIET